jgi:hypothetical protein
MQPQLSFHPLQLSCTLFNSGPLLAVIDAQAKAASTTVKFIQGMGFDSEGHARTVDFGYSTTNTTTGIVEEKKLRVPLLTIVPIPFIRVRLVDGRGEAFPPFTLHLWI